MGLDLVQTCLVRVRPGDQSGQSLGRGGGHLFVEAAVCHLGYDQDLVPFYYQLFWGRVPLLE